MEQLAAAALPDVARVVVVLEGAARPGAAAGRQRGVEVVHADGSGDDVLVVLAAPGVRVVTADRALAERVRERGADVVGPRWLLALLDAR